MLMVDYRQGVLSRRLKTSRFSCRFVFHLTTNDGQMKKKHTTPTRRITDRTNRQRQKKTQADATKFHVLAVKWKTIFVVKLSCVRISTFIFASNRCVFARFAYFVTSTFSLIGLFRRSLHLLDFLVSLSDCEKKNAMKKESLNEHSTHNNIVSSLQKSYWSFLSLLSYSCCFLVFEQTVVEHWRRIYFLSLNLNISFLINNHREFLLIDDDGRWSKLVREIFSVTTTEIHRERSNICCRRKDSLMMLFRHVECSIERSLVSTVTSCPLFYLLFLSITAMPMRNFQ